MMKMLVYTVAILMQMNSLLFHISTGYYLAKRRLQNIVYSWYRAMKMSHMNAPSRLTGMENVLPISCTYIDVRHRILQDIRSKLNINKHDEQKFRGRHAYLLLR